MDFRLRSNLAMIVLVLLAAAVALGFWLNGGSGELFLAPAHVFVVWALLREIDPDHQWTALVAAAAAGVWVLAGGARLSVLAILALMIAGRLVTESTGRRPLTTDLLGTAAVGTAIGFTPEGWLAGFGLGIGLYLDERLAPGVNRIQLIIAGVTALGTTVVATVFDAFGDSPPAIKPLVAVVAGVVALLLVLRDPAPPKSPVDSRRGGFIGETRLHVSRTAVAITVFAMTLLVGGYGSLPVLFGLALAVISNEIELRTNR